MPSTATIEAMPIAMPTADSAARRRRVRSPMLPTARTSRGSRRLGRGRGRGRGRGCGRRGAGAHDRPASLTISPSRSSTRRGNAAATCGSCVMTTSVVPAAFSSPSSATISAPVRVSSEPVGSSAKTIRGSPTSARAIAVRWRSPPDSSDGRWPTRWPRPTRSSAARARSRRSFAADARVEQAARHVVERRQPVEQVELLKDEAHAPRAQRRELVVGGRGGVDAVDRDVAGRRAVERAHDLQQRRLARARRAEDRDELAAGDVEVDAAQRVDVPGVLLDDAAQRHEVGHQTAALATRMPGRSPLPSMAT